MDLERENIVVEFLVESSENLDSMEETVVALEADPGNSALLGIIFRNAHTIKGAAASLGFEALTDFTHGLENVLQRLRERSLQLTPALATVLLSAVDVARTLIKDAGNGLDWLHPDHQMLLDEIDQYSKTAGEPGAQEFPEPHESSGPNVFVADAGSLARNRSLRVDIEKLDRMLNLASEITIFRGRLEQQIAALPPSAQREVVAETHQEVSNLYVELQEYVMKLRMVPIGPTLRKYIRSVRDLARSCGKLARVEIDGRDVEIDSRVIEQLKDPLSHMIRNAVDHGIESPAERQAAGKDPMGRLTLRAMHEAGSVVIQLTDDGAGLDPQRIASRAREMGLADAPEFLPNAELYAYVFEPGFSTRDEVTEISGRGVGLDVVKRNVEHLRGTIAIDSIKGQGTVFTIRLPLTMAIIDGFGVAMGDDTYIVPLDSVAECLVLPAGTMNTQGRGYMELRGQPLPLMWLRDLFSLGGQAPAAENVVVVRQGDMTLGLVADVLLGDSKTVVKPLGKMFQHVQGVSASTILGSGRVALILDIPGLVGLVPHVKI